MYINNIYIIKSGIFMYNNRRSFIFNKRKAISIFLALFLIFTNFFTVYADSSTVNPSTKLTTEIITIEELEQDQEILQYLVENEIDVDEFIEEIKDLEDEDILVIKDNSTKNRSNRSIGDTIKSVVVFNYYVTSAGFTITAKAIRKESFIVTGLLTMKRMNRSEWVDTDKQEIIPEVVVEGHKGFFPKARYVYTWEIEQEYLAEKFEYTIIVEENDGTVFPAINVGKKKYIREKFEGNSYGNLEALGGERHHCPENAINGLKKNDGPCIQMLYADHRATKSCGRGKAADAYRKKQKKLIDNGDFEGAMQMDIDDIQDQFGHKYDHAIDEMLEYARDAGYID
jgi:hypothetical protein